MNARLAAAALGLALAFGTTSAAQANTCHAGPFSGFYAGINAGYAKSDIEITSPIDPKVSADDSSFTIGGHAGYNMQCGRMVLGIEGDIGYLGLESKGAFAGPVNLKDEISWFGTLRGKAGVTVDDHMMIYVTGGLAFADVDHTLSDPAFPFSQTDGGFRTGWTIGGGVEFIRDSRWMLRAEALYVDLGDEDRHYTVTTGGCFPVACEGDAKWDDSFWVARVGLSYKFGARDEHVPLK